MAQTILCIKKGRDRGRFISELRQAGLKFRSIDGLPRHFVIDGVAPDAFLGRGDTAIDAIDDGEALVRPADQALTLDVYLEQGSWAIARTIRRRAPWNVDHMRHPIETYFRCVRDGTGVDFYLLDTGTRSTHVEFGGRATNVYEFSSTGGAGDLHGHGTRIGGYGAGETTGLARGALLWSFGIETPAGAGTTSTTAVATAIGQLLIHYNGRSGTNRPAVANLSYTPIFGGAANSALGDLIDAGIVVCVSAGNAGELLTVEAHPTAFVSDIIVAGAAGPADLPAYSAYNGAMVITNYGSQIDLVGPGQFTRAAAIAGDSDYFLGGGGTSAATGYTSGVIACMLQGHSRLTGRTQVQAVKTALLANATTGKLRSDFGLSPLPDKILYLDPDQTAPETITGL
jgi:subtilisin family serine protease